MISDCVDRQLLHKQYLKHFRIPYDHSMLSSAQSSAFCYLIISGFLSIPTTPSPMWACPRLGGHVCMHTGEQDNDEVHCKQLRLGWTMSGNIWVRSGSKKKVWDCVIKKTAKKKGIIFMMQSQSSSQKLSFTPKFDTGGKKIVGNKHSPTLGSESSW